MACRRKSFRRVCGPVISFPFEMKNQKDTRQFCLDLEETGKITLKKKAYAFFFANMVFILVVEIPSVRGR